MKIQGKCDCPQMRLQRASQDFHALPFCSGNDCASPACLDTQGKDGTTLPMKHLFWLLLFAGLVTGCSAAHPAETAASAATITTPLPPTTTGTPFFTPTASQTVPPSPTATRPPASQTPEPTSLPACVTLVYEEYAQFEIIGPTGERVLVDIYDPARLTRPAEATDILLTTHTHWDHVNDDFVAAFPGAQLFAQIGELETGRVSVVGIASAHNAGDTLKPEGGTNYIYRIDIGGLRIAHFGDTGQNAFTEDQLEALKDVDIAITQINNPYSEMSAENGKGIRLMKQVQPRLVIPTHLNLDTVKLAVQHWPPGYFAPAPTLKICDGDLTGNTQFLLMGDAVETMRRYVDLAAWETGGE